MGLVENDDSRLPIPIAVSGPRNSDPKLLLPSIIEKAIIITPSSTTSTSHSIPTTLYPLTLATPSPSAPTVCPPPPSAEQEVDTSPPWSLEHGNLRNTYTILKIPKEGEAPLFRFWRSAISSPSRWSMAIIWSRCLRRGIKKRWAPFLGSAW